MKKIHKKIWIPVVLAGVLIGGYLYLDKENVTVRVGTAPSGEKVVQVNEQNNKVDREFPFSMSENSVQQAIHNMSHQKVLAKKKWGALPLTPERVKRLLQVVEANKKKYGNADLYLSILRSWDKGNFDHVVINHNAFLLAESTLQPEGLLHTRGMAASGLRPLCNIPHCCLP